MTKRLRVLLTAAAIATVAAAPTFVPHVGEAEAQRRRPRRPRTPPPPPAQQPAPEPAPVEVEPEVEIEINPDQPPPIEISPDAPPPVEVDASTPPPPPKAEGDKEASWEDVVVVVRKPFLKDGRLELTPSWQVSLNDNMIRHHAFTGHLRYWLTDVLAVGVEGQIYTGSFLEPKKLVGLAYRRLPTLNEYNWAAALNFHYAPIYAKFAVFNKWVVHWEGMFTAGVGIVQSEVLPRNTEHRGWTNLLIAPNVGFEARVFVTRWVTLDLGIKDYIFVDKFESVNRMQADIEMSKAEATSQLINNIMFTAGLSFWVPMGFQYTTFR